MNTVTKKKGLIQNLPEGCVKGLRTKTGGEWVLQGGGN